MHLKNFSLYETADKIRLTPVYDLLNVVIINPKDDEELALTLNGRKKAAKGRFYQISSLFGDSDCNY